MKVLTVRSVLSDMGPGTQPLTVAREMTHRGVDTVFATSGGAYMEEVSKAGYEVHVIPRLAVDRRGFLDVLAAIRNLRRVIIAERPDVIHGHNAAATILAYLAGVAAGRNVPCVTSVRGVEERESHQHRNRVWKRTPGKLLAVCEKGRERLRSFGVPDSKIITTYNGVDPVKFDPDRWDGRDSRSEFGLEGKLVVATVGAMVGPPHLGGPGKGQHLLIEAIARLKDHHPELTALLVGDGPHRPNAERAAREFGIEDRVVFAGRRFDVPALLAAADIYCLPSIYGEFFPNSILEAMCMGLPWIGSDIAGLSELTAGGEAGWVSPIGDVEALANNLDRLAADATLRRTMGARARQEVMQRFTIQVVTDRILGAYRDAGLSRATLHRTSGEAHGRPSATATD